MKTLITILTLIISIQVFGQIEPEIELERIFYSLPIRSDIEKIIDSVKTIDLIEPYQRDYDTTSKPYFSGHISKNEYFTNEKLSGQIEIFRSNYYTLWGTELDSLDVLYISLDYSDQHRKVMEKQYKRLVKIFKKLTEKSEKYKLYADPGIIGYGYCFFKTEKDKLPFMSIEIGLGDCVSDTKSFIVNYYKIENHGIQLD